MLTAESEIQMSSTPTVFRTQHKDNFSDPNFSCLIFHRLHKQEMTEVSVWVKTAQAHSNYTEIPFMMTKYIPSKLEVSLQTHTHTQNILHTGTNKIQQNVNIHSQQMLRNNDPVLRLRYSIPSTVFFFQYTFEFASSALSIRKCRICTFCRICTLFFLSPKAGFVLVLVIYSHTT